MTYVIMSGSKYGQFDFGKRSEGQKRVRAVSWVGGSTGVQVATRFSDKEEAKDAASQVNGTDGSPRVVEAND